LTDSPLVLQAAFADINIHKSRSVYYGLANGGKHVNLTEEAMTTTPGREETRGG